jgi:hypothetical protein
MTDVNSYWSVRNFVILHDPPNEKSSEGDPCTCVHERFARPCAMESCRKVMITICSARWFVFMFTYDTTITEQSSWFWLLGLSVRISVWLMPSLFWTKEFQCYINSNGLSCLPVYGLCYHCLLLDYCSAESTAYTGRIILHDLNKRTWDGEKQELVASSVKT